MINFFKIFFTFLLIIVSSECFAQYIPNFAEMQRLIQEEVSKIDIESLGLDKTEKTPSPTQEKPPEVQKNIVDSITKIEEKNIQDLQNKNIAKPSINNNFPTKKPVKNIKKKSRKKIKKSTQEINDKDVENLNNENAYAQDSLEGEGNTTSAKSKLRLELEKNEKITLNEKKQQEKLQKFEELKSFYLFDLIKKEDAWDEDFNNDEKIIPKRKELAPFALEELPPLPILNRSRTATNFHIPFVYTPKEYIDIMFSAISNGSISYFNEAFKYVLNPNITNDQGDTILTYAIFLKKYSVISSVLAKGADPNLPNKLGHNPVSIAIELVEKQFTI